MSDIFTVDLAARALAWAILQSLWQGGAIAVLTALVLRSLRGRSPDARYVVSCLGLAALALSWSLTAVSYAVSNPADHTTANSISPQTDERQAVLTTGPLPSSTPDLPAASVLPASWTARVEEWSPVIMPLWLAGVLLLSARLACGWLLIQRIRRRATEPVPDMWLTRIQAMAKRLAIARPVRVAQSAAVHVPTVIGWLRPAVLLPACVFSGLSPAQLEAIIAHELAHVRRHDYAMNILQMVAEIVLFYHPASWWLSRQVRIEREHCCDDIAVAACGSRYVYAEALADLETLRSSSPALGLAATDGPLVQRIRRLVTPVSAGSGYSAAWAAAPLAVLTLVVMSTSVIGMQSPGAATTQTPTPSAPRTIPATEGDVQGQVVDARSGRPVARATIELLGPERATTVVAGDDGRFEARGLVPAQYRVWARFAGYAPAQYGQRELTDRAVMVDVSGGQLTRGIDFRLHAVGALSGRILNERGEGVAGVEVELVAEGYAQNGPRPLGFAQTEELGVYRFAEVLPGDYYVRGYVAGSDTLRPSVERLAQQALGQDVYGMTYYPSVTSVQQAQSLRVNAGQELFDVDFALATVKTHRIAGTVVDPTGRPLAQTHVMIHPMAANRSGSERRTQVDASGRFEFRDLVPADYMINVLERTPGPSRWMSAAQFLTLDRDIVGLELKAQGAVRVEGRVVRDAAVTRPLDPAAVRVGFVKRVGPVKMNLDSHPKEDGTFFIESPGGPVSFQVVGLPPSWAVKSVRLDGVEIGGEPIDFGADARKRIEVILTDRVSSVTGTVQDKDGRPLADHSVVIFPDDSSLWSGESRLIRETRTDRAGQFRIQGLQPAPYLAVAIESLPFMAWMDPQVLERLRPLATRLNLGEGQQVTLSLKVAPPLERVGPNLVGFSLKQVVSAWLTRMF